MTQVAILINERKRRMEALGRLRTWQNNVDNWKVWTTKLHVHTCTCTHVLYVHKYCVATSKLLS